MLRVFVDFVLLWAKELVTILTITACVTPFFYFKDVNWILSAEAWFKSYSKKDIVS